MVSSIFDTLGTIAQSFATLLVSLFESVVSIFWTAGTGEQAGQLTVVGILMLIGIGTGLVIWAFRFIRSLIRIRTRG